jgi:hypothetical protein
MIRYIGFQEKHHFFRAKIGKKNFRAKIGKNWPRSCAHLFLVQLQVGPSFERLEADFARHRELVVGRHLHVRGLEKN